MQKQFHFLSPIEVVKVTSHNLQEVAEWCGGKVAETPSTHRPGTMDKYVWVPTPKGTTISWAFPGMFVTKRLVRSVKDDLRVTFAVFRRDYFEKNYFASPDEAVTHTWERHFKEEAKKTKPAPKPAAPKNKIKGTSMEDYVPDEGETTKVKVTQKGSGVETVVDLSEAVTVSEARRGVTVAPVAPAEEQNIEKVQSPDKVADEDVVVPDVDFRSADTGQYVTEEFAEANPDTTVAEVDKVADEVTSDVKE